MKTAVDAWNSITLITFSVNLISFSYDYKYYKLLTTQDPVTNISLLKPRVCLSEFVSKDEINFMNFMYLTKVIR